MESYREALAGELAELEAAHSCLSLSGRAARASGYEYLRWSAPVGFTPP